MVTQLPKRELELCAVLLYRPRYQGSDRTSHHEDDL